jgi:hypothetical protein
MLAKMADKDAEELFTMGCWTKDVGCRGCKNSLAWFKYRRRAIPHVNCVGIFIEIFFVIIQRVRKPLQCLITVSWDVWCVLGPTIEMNNRLWAHWRSNLGGLPIEAYFGCWDSCLGDF